MSPPHPAQDHASSSTQTSTRLLENNMFDSFKEILPFLFSWTMIQFQIEHSHAIKTISCKKCNFKSSTLITTFGVIEGRII